MSYFTHGDAVFYLPEFPYSGEVETSNMLMSLELWQHLENIGNCSPLRQITVVTPNDRLISKSDKLNDFYLNKLAAHGANIVYGKRMTAINDRITIL
jgi:sulfide:quinone oxidoreductase